jgi:prepilin-type N-terminal cleavage/methylation domain-containing protein
MKTRYTFWRVAKAPPFGQSSALHYRTISAAQHRYLDFHAFTLIELLTVIAIIAILPGPQNSLYFQDLIWTPLLSQSE